MSKTIRRASKYRSLELARASIAHYTKPWNYSIVMGDCDEQGGVYWVVTNRQAGQLRRAGYEVVS